MVVEIHKPKNTVNRLAYCDACRPAVGVAFGGLNPNYPIRHVEQKTGNIHVAKVVEIGSSEHPNPKEPLQKFLDRMTKKYVK